MGGPHCPEKLQPLGRPGAKVPARDVQPRIPGFVDWKKVTSAVYESLASLGTMREQFRVPLKCLDITVDCDIRGVSGSPQFVPHDTERRQSLGQLYARSLLFLLPGCGGNSLAFLFLRTPQYVRGVSGEENKTNPATDGLFGAVLVINIKAIVF